MTKVKEIMKLKNEHLHRYGITAYTSKQKKITGIGYYANTKQNSRVMNKLLTSQRLFKAS